MIYKAYKFKLKPNREQENLILRTIGSSRFVFNHFLSLWNKVYQETDKGLSYSKCSAKLPGLKVEFPWLKEVDSIALQASVKNLGDSFDHFFKKKNGYPNFKSKKYSNQAYTTKCTNDNISICGNYIKLPKLGLVKFAKSREVEGKIIKATIKRKPTGKYYVSIVCEVEIKLFEKTNQSVGIDLGLTNFAILSSGEKIDNLHFSTEMAQKLAREQHKLSKRALLAKEKGICLLDAKNYQKQKLKVAQLHEKIANQREDFLHKLSTEIVKNYDIISIEDLNVKGMVKNRKLSKAIADVSWGKFVEMLEYKADWYGKEVVRISRWYPSSQICSECGYRDGEKSLDIREWICPNCGNVLDRDINASINILNEGLRLLSA
jgi:putative transposase